jgi:MFS family permease
MELAVRRRMIGEVVAFDQIGPAVAFDSLTNSIARVLGPLAGGAVFETLGLGGAYLLSAVLFLAAGFVVSGLDFRQEARKLRFGRIPIDIVEGLAVARANPAILAVVHFPVFGPAIGTKEIRRYDKGPWLFEREREFA